MTFSKTIFAISIFGVLGFLCLLAWGLGFFGSNGLRFDFAGLSIQTAKTENPELGKTAEDKVLDSIKNAPVEKLPEGNAEDKILNLRRQQTEPEKVLSLFTEAWKSGDGFVLDALRLPNYKYKGENTKLPSTVELEILEQKNISETRKAILIEQDNLAGRLRKALLCWQEKDLWYIRTASLEDKDVLNALGMKSPREVKKN